MKKHKLLLFLIIVLGLFLRLNHPIELSHFEMDEEVIAWKTEKFWRDGQPFLIGGGTPFGIHLGPAFYYLSALPLIFTKGDPIGWMILIVLLSISNLYLIWLVGKTLYSETVGLVAAALWAFSFTTVMFDRHWWPLAMDPLLSLLTILSLFHIMKGRAKWWIVFGLTLVFAWQTDLTNLVLFIATAIVIVRSLRPARNATHSEAGGRGNLTSKTNSRYIWVGLSIFLLSFVPLVIFEVRHPGVNLGALKFSNFLRSDLAYARSDLLKPVQDLSSFIPFVFSSFLVPNFRSSNLSDRYTWCKDIAASRISSPPIMMAFTAGIMLLPVIRWIRKKSPADFVLTVLLVSGIAGIAVFRFFGGDLFDFYLAPLYPVFILTVSLVIVSLVAKFFKPFNRLIILTILTIFLYFNIRLILTTTHSQGLGTKRQAIAWVAEQVGDRPFALESLSRCHRYNGIRYLFMLDGNEPVVSFMDPSLSWLYDAPPSSTPPDLFVAFVTSNDLTSEDLSRYNAFKRRAIDSKQFGDFDVIVADNHDGTLRVDFSTAENPSD